MSKPKYNKLFKVNGAKVYLEIYNEPMAIDNISLFKKRSLWKRFLFALNILVCKITFYRVHIPGASHFVDEVIYLSKNESEKIRNLLEFVADGKEF